jgi:uncharacterized protein YecE (DUF72 family)
MSRPSALRETLTLSSPDDDEYHSLDVISVPPTGDCFYDCIHELLSRSHRSRTEDDDADCDGRDVVIKCHDDVARSSPSSNPNDDAIMPTSRRLREYVASRLTNEQLDMYRIYADAGFDEYDFAIGMTSLANLKEYATRSGGGGHGEDDAGPGNCMWADEFALRTVSDWLRLTLLIVDDQATRGRGRGRGGTGGSAKNDRKRTRDDAGHENPSSYSSSLPSGDGRFVRIGNHERAVILHRSRRQHYNAVVVDGRHVLDGIESLPSRVRSLWGWSAIVEARLDEGYVKRPDSYIDESYGGSREGFVALINDQPASSVATPIPRPGCAQDGCNVDLDLEAARPINNIHVDGSITTGDEAKSLIVRPMSSSFNGTLGNFYCGCAGFSSASWVGNFYPKYIVGRDADRQLEHYQGHFRTVEINSTFYGIPSDSTVGRWRGAFAGSFRVTMKAPRGLTHDRPFLDISVLSTFLTHMECLGDCLACILIQCPRTLEVTKSQLVQMRAMMDGEAGWYRGRIAFEFRNESTYYDEEVRDFLRLNNYTLVVHPNSLGRSTIGTSTSGRGNADDLLEYQPEDLSSLAAGGGMQSNFVYLRLHGSNDEHRGEYSLSQLEGIAKQIHSWREQYLDVYCYILNDQLPGHKPKNTPVQPWDSWCAMPKNAKQLEYLVYGLSNEDIPDGPKKPKSTLLNYFGKS